jgi:altronate dehydratase
MFISLTIFLPIGAIMNTAIPFDEVARLPMPGDNVAIATLKLTAGMRIDVQGSEITLSHTLMEGHRFSIAEILSGAPLLSWGLPFGVATKDITPGDYVCNIGIIEALGMRNLDFDLPAEPNFVDRIVPFDVDGADFKPGKQVEMTDTPRTFEGYRREGRGVGTRNVILLLGTSSRTGSFVKLLEQRFKDTPQKWPNIDGIVAVAHTEGGEDERPNNYEYVLRTLAGFCVHPNVGAVVAVDYGTEAITNDDLSAYLSKNKYPISSLPHAFHRLEKGLTDGLDEAEAIVGDWLETVNATPRTQEPVSELKIALQCGGSDAFSGVSGNPLVAWVAREVIRNGGAANLAETDELIGAEAYVLQNAKDIDTAKRFVKKVEGYKELAAWHGTTAEGNPSGGNKYRGLYNIVLKSIGAAMKRHPDVRLDAVIDYSEPMVDPGYYFMDSPGNDLESIAGQVASGCNLIFFVTGNGSITNFPFVPTLKVITTTGRYELLSSEMDVNAGAYLDGTSMNELGAELFEQTLKVSSGERSNGERAEHSQVSLWRNWRQTDTQNLLSIESTPLPTQKRLEILDPKEPFEQTFRARQGADGTPCSDAIGLLLPTSLCSGQIAQKCADILNEKAVGAPELSRYTALVHTEGCGVAGEETERIYTRSMLNYLTHPSVKYGFILEHGCEKTHNDFIRHHLAENGIDQGRFGWASIQLDGGIDNVIGMAEDWFRNRTSEDVEGPRSDELLSKLRIGIASEGPVSDVCAQVVGELANRLASAGGTVILPVTSGLWQNAAFLEETVGAFSGRPTIAHGGRPESPGLHAMENPTSHWVETLTGLAAAGTDIIVAVAGEHPLQGHPIVPVLQVGDVAFATSFDSDIDQLLEAGDGDVEALADLLANTATGSYETKAKQIGNADFQFTRGLLGVSM